MILINALQNYRLNTYSIWFVLKKIKIRYYIKKRSGFLVASISKEPTVILLRLKRVLYVSCYFLMPINLFLDPVLGVYVKKN